MPDSLLRNIWIAPAILAALTALSAFGQVYKYTGPIGALPYTAGVAVACYLACRHLETLARFKRVWPSLMIAIALFIIAAFLVLYPIAQSGQWGGGTDRDEALNIALDAVSAGQYPYYLRTYLNNDLSPAPGALLLAAPAWLLGNAAWQNIPWIALFFLFLWRSFAPTLAVLLAVAIACNAGVMQDIVTGGDYVINAIYVALAVAAVMATARDAPLLHCAALIFLGIAICSRPIYAVAPVALAALFWRHLGPRAALRVLAVAGAVALALGLPIYLHDPAAFTPLHQPTSYVTIPIPHASTALGLAALTIALMASRIPFDLFALYGTIALALSVMFIPVAIHWMLIGKYLSFAHATAPLTLFGALWAAKWIERQHGTATR